MPSKAVSAEVETKDWGPAAVPDMGVYVLPIVDNVANASQRIRVYRYNEVSIAGGLFGSRMRVEVRQTLQPFTVQ